MRRGNRAAALADLDRGLRESNSGGKEGEEGMAERRRVVVGDGKDEAGGLVRRRGGALWPAAQKEGIGVGGETWDWEDRGGVNPWQARVGWVWSAEWAQ
jgi:hypothetical protein